VLAGQSFGEQRRGWPRRGGAAMIMGVHSFTTVRPPWRNCGVPWRRVRRAEAERGASCSRRLSEPR
jgi:hypothetical protein